jgi:ataxia telangiectasia mutated family protein
LREKWFEDSLNKVSRWDDSLLPKVNDAEQLAHSGKIREVPFFQENVPSGFYESVNHALSSLAKGDIVGGLSNITHARRSVLADMESLVGSESQLKGMATHLSRLSVIGNFELTARTLEGSSPISFLLSRWGFRSEAGVEKLESLLMESDQYSFNMESNGNEVDTNLARRVSTEFSVQETLLKLLISKCEPEQGDIVEALTSHVFKSCHIYRDLGRADSASLSLTRLRSLVQIFQQRGTTYSPNLPMILRLEDAKLWKCQNDLDTAVMHCKIISSHLSSPEDVETNVERDSLLADSLLLGSLWMAEQNVDTAPSILSSFQKASHLSMKVHKKAKAMGASHTASSIRKASIAGFKLGEFAASLYHSVETRMSREAWKKRCAAASERKKEFDMATKEEQKVKKKKSRSSADEKLLTDLLAVKSTLEKEIDMDEREIGSVKDALRQYLRMSVESYCAALRLCPTSVAANVSKHVFQLVSLWFKNCLRAETNDIVNGLMSENVLSIPSYRFVPLTYQLFSRIESVEEIGGTDFQNILRDMVLKICTEHPYHGIVQLIALANGKRVGSGVNGRNADAYLENVGGSKVEAAKSLLNDLRKCEKEYIPALVESYKTLADAFIELAMFSTKAWDNKPAIGLSFSQLNLSLDSCFSSGRRGSKNTSAANNMPVIFTNPPPIQPNAQYGDGKEDPIGAERVVGFESEFDLTPTGNLRPKIVKCRGSKGGLHTQLVKGLDDLRQDAIMEQVFGTVNDLLRHEGVGGNNMIKQTLGTSAIPRSSRHLRLITYGVTPLSPTAGVLEWVNDTMCIGDYLEDKRGNLGAHSRYNPGEWGSAECGDIFYHVAEKHASDHESRRRTYKKICENFSPGMCID